MKILNLFTLILFATTVMSCANDDNSDEPYNDNLEMTANLNGTAYTFERSNLSEPQHPIEDYVFIPGWTVNLNDGGANNIHLYINRNNLAIGTYTVTNTDADAEIYLYFNSNGNQEEETTVNGTLTITEIDTNAKTIKGTFTFQTSPDPESETPVINYDIQNGNFSCIYE